MVRSFWCSLQRLSSSLSSQTSLFSKAELHLHSSTPRRSSHCPHLLTHYFTAPRSANPRHRVTVTQCFTPNHWPLSQLHSTNPESIPYIWVVYISDLLVIARYFAYFTSNQGLVMRSLLLCFFFSFFFFVWCLGFRIWCLMVSTRDDGFSTHGDESLRICFFLFLWCLGKHFIWSIETRGYGFSTVVNLCFSVCSFFFFFLCLMFG